VPFDMKQDANGFLYLAGYTLSAGLPATAGALQAQYDGTMDAFALKFALPSRIAAGGIGYFTYLGSDGLQIAYGIDFGLARKYLPGRRHERGRSSMRLGGPGEDQQSGKPRCLRGRF